MDKDAEIISFKFDDQIEQGQEVSFKIEINFKRIISKPIFMIHMHSNSNESLIFLIIQTMKDILGNLWRVDSCSILRLNP